MKSWADRYACYIPLLFELMYDIDNCFSIIHICCKQICICCKKILYGQKVHKKPRADMQAFFLNNFIGCVLFEQTHFWDTLKKPLFRQLWKTKIYIKKKKKKYVPKHFPSNMMGRHLLAFLVIISPLYCFDFRLKYIHFF